MMTTENEFDLAKMQQRVDEKRKKQEQETYDQWDKERQRAYDEQAEVNELFAKAILADREEQEKIKQKETDEQLARLNDEIDSAWEAKGIKTDKTLKQEQGYKKLLDGIPGLNDQHV